MTLAAGMKSVYYTYNDRVCGKGGRPLELNRKNVRIILLIIVFTVVLFSVMQHLGDVFGVAAWVWKVFSSVTAGLAIAFVLNVPLRIFENRAFYGLREHRSPTVRKLLRPAAIVCSLLVTLGVIIVLLLVIFPRLVETVGTVIAQMPDYVNDLIAWADRVLEPFDFSLSAYLGDINWDKVFTDIGNTLAESVDGLIGTAGDVVGTAANVGTAIVSGVIDVVFSTIIAVYILAQKEKIGRFMRQCIDAFFPRRFAHGFERLAARAGETFANFISGQLMDSSILGVLCFIGMTIFRFPHADVISVVIGVTSLVPLVGAFVGVAIGALLILTTDAIKALLFIVFMLCLQQVEGNLIYPKVVGKAVGMPGLLVLCAVLVGGNIAGILGSLCSVPLTAMLYAMLREAVDERLERRVGPRSPKPD